MIARWVCLAALLSGAATAYADDARARARVLYDHGMAHYNVGDYDAAVGEFKQAYELTRAPGLLFNLAQACRLAKHDEEALHFYRSYLREKPNAGNRKDAKAFIAELEKRVAAKGAVAPPPVEKPVEQPVVAEPVTPEPATPPAPSPPANTTTSTPATVSVTAPTAPSAPSSSAPLSSVGSRRGSRVWAAGAGVVGAIGLAALGTAAGFAAAESDASRSVAGATVWSGDLQRTWDDGQRDASVATALFVVGGVATGAAIVMAIVAARKSPKRLALVPAPGAMGWACAF